MGASSSVAIAEGVPPAAEPVAAAAPATSGPTKEGQLFIGDAKAPVMTCQVAVGSAAALRDFVGVFVLPISVTSFYFSYRRMPLELSTRTMFVWTDALLAYW